MSDRTRRTRPRDLFLEPKRSETRRFSFSWVGTLIAGLLIVFFIAALFVFRAPTFRIKEISVGGTRFLDPAILETEARASLEGFVFWIVPRDSIFILSSHGLGEAMKQKYPSIAAIEVSKRFPARLDIQVRERSLWGISCVTGGEVCAYIDRDGELYDTLAEVRGWIVPMIYRAPGVSSPERISPELMSRYTEAVESLLPSEVRILWMSEATSTPDLRFGTAEGWEIIVPEARPVSEWALLLQSILAEEVRARRAELEYVDIRFGNKVFYRFRE
jgi:cell division septal protein FtsQ